MKIILGTDMRTDKHIPDQEYDIKLNVAADENAVLIVSKNDVFY